MLIQGCDIVVCAWLETSITSFDLDDMATTSASQVKTSMKQNKKRLLGWQRLRKK